MAKVIHLIPYDGIGGVETAARSMGTLKNEILDFEVNYICAGCTAGKSPASSFNPWHLFTTAWHICNSQTDILIISLWRSAIVGLLAKLLRPQIKLVAFLHCPTDVHLLDSVFTGLSVCFSTEVWADSQATLSGRVPGIRSEKCRVISFVTRRFEVLPAKPANPSFIFWGRISQEKGLDRAIRLFAKVHKRYPIARFWVVGPDAGAQHAAQALCVSLGLKNAVIFMGNATLDEIVGYALPASFYLQTSHFEGMAMSVVEAMQLGLVPVVTPVGEIAHYCQDGQNAVIIGADQQAVEDVISLLVAGERYQAMRANAIATWAHQPLYRDSVLSACENALRGRHAT